MAKQSIILSIISFFLSFFMTQAQQNFEKQWLEIVQLEIDRKVTTALEKVNFVYKKALASKNDTQRLKALLFRWKFQQIVDEKSQVVILKNVAYEIDQADAPSKNILYMYLASFLESYYNDNYWRISKRTPTEDADLKDYRTWDAKTFIKQISNFYEKALENSTSLASQPIEKYTDLLVTVPISRKLKPTLFDLIAHKALNFYKNSRNTIQPKEAFIIDNETYFDLPEAFYSQNITTPDENSFPYQSLKIYQNLERVHSQKNHKEALIFTVSERFQYVKSNWKGGNTDEVYFNHLKKLQQQFPNTSIDIKLAEAYRTLSFQKNEAGKYVYPDYNNKALALISNIEKTSKDTRILIPVENLKSQILQKKLEWQTQSLYLPNKKHLAKLTFANTEKATLKAYKVDFEFEPNELKPYLEKDSILRKYLKKQQLLFTKTYELPKRKDHNSYSTEVIVPKLPLGHYIFTLKADTEEESWKYHEQTVTEIGLNKTLLGNKTRYQIVNRYTGAPIAGTEVTVKHKIGNYRNYSWKTKQETTDQEGFFYDSNSDNNGHQIIVKLPQDTLKISDRNYRRRGEIDDANQNKKYQSKTLLFLDRAIYRPGQKVYFKAIAIQKVDEISNCIADTKIKIEVKDVNHQLVHTQTLSTNEYGSVNGDFDLPKNRLTGNFHISASIIEPKDSRRNQNANTNFSVEEYKRPTFEVTFEPATEIFRLNDTVVVKGNAKAFFGGNITDAKVKYVVKRTVKPMFWWWRSYLNNQNEKQITTGELTTDENGKFEINFIAETGTPEIENKIFNYEITAKVTDVNGETREASQTIKVADKNLLSSIDVSETLQSNVLTEVKIKTTDVNDNPIKANGTLTVYKLKAPNRYLNNRPWGVPDIQEIDKSTFEKTFTHIPYSDEKDPKNWTKGTSFCEHTFENTSEAIIELDNMKDWPAGKYLLVTKVSDPITNTTTENQKTVTLEHSKQKIPADNQILNFSVDYNAKSKSRATIHLSTSVDTLYPIVELYDGNRIIYHKAISLQKGSNSLIISLPKLNYDKVTAKVFYHLFNTLYTKQEVLDYSKIPVNLVIEKQHFTDKLTPGGKETWSFKLKSSDGNRVNAEGLASMYDASLDQFKTHTWNTNFGFKGYTPPAPNTQELNRISTSKVYYNQQIDRIPLPEITVEKLNLYGFTFNRINSWEYREYLNDLNYLTILESIKTIKDYGKSGKAYGQIIDGSVNEPLPFANVSIFNSNKVTTTDFEGNFSLDAKVGELLEVSFVGYKTVLFPIEKVDRPIIITLNTGASSLNSVIISSESSKRVSKQRIAAKSLSSNMSFSDWDSTEYETDETPEKEIPNISSNNQDLSSLKAIKARENLNETAFFLPNLKTNKKGEIEFEFTSPEALTKWNLQLLAHTQNATWGKLDAEALTQKDLNIIPNAPRFLREGDQLLFSAKISNLSDKVLNGTALLEWTNPIDGAVITKQLKQANDTQNFTIAANGNTEVSWKIEIPEGLGAIQYKIVAKAGNATDGQTAAIPVLTNRKLVTESIAMWVRPGETETYTLNNFDTNSTTQKPHQITLEYTSNPAWMAIKSLPYLIEFPHECSEQTFSRMYANSIASHIINSHPKIKQVFESWEANGVLESPLEKNLALKEVLIAESPWLRDTQSETEQQKRLVELFDIQKMSRANERAIQKLQQLQKASGGFPWFSGGRENPFITRHIVAGFGHLERLGVIEQRKKTDNILQKAIQYLDRELENEFNEFKNRTQKVDDFYKRISLLHFAYARSYHLDRFPIKGLAKDIVEKALSYQNKNWQQRSLYQKGLLALTLHRFETSPKTVSKIMTALVETAVQSKANGMYWKENQAGWYWYQSIISTQALLIEAFTETNQPQKYIEELKVFLLKNKRTNRWDNTISTANACYALLLSGNDWLSVKDGVKFNLPTGKTGTLYNKVQTAISSKEAGSGYFKTQWNADEIDASFKTIEVKNTGNVTNYGGYYWQYFEDLNKIKVDDQGPLSIDKELYLKVTTDNGTELKRITTVTPLQRGDKVTVRLLIKSEDHLEYVHLKDMRASGFEPTEVLSGYKYKENLWYYQSTKDVATHFFIDRMSKGNYVLEYDVIANQTGDFSNGITTLQCMYAPEFSNHSSGQRIEIK